MVKNRQTFSAFKHLVQKTALVAAAALTGSQAMAADPIKVGILLPYSGTFAQLGERTDQGLRLAIEQNGGKLGGRDVEYVVVDSEANPNKAISNMQQLVSGEKVDVVVGPVHSGVAMGMLKVAHQNDDVLMIIPNAGLNAATRQLCAPNVFRTSFSSWQFNHPMAKVAWDKGHRKIATIGWKYAAGKEQLDAFQEGFEELGGTIVRNIEVPFPEVEFQAQLTEIANLKPDAVYAFFAGGGASKFLKDYAAAGLMNNIPLMGSGALTEDTLNGLGNTANGVLTGLHYADGLDIPANKAFQAAFKERYGKDNNLYYAMQGYDTGLLLIKALDQVKGNTKDKKALIKAMENVKFDNSPRGEWEFSKAHNPIQDIYLREVQGEKNVVLGLAGEDVNDPATGCKMAK